MPSGIRTVWLTPQRAHGSAWAAPGLPHCAGLSLGLGPKNVVDLGTARVSGSPFVFCPCVRACARGGVGGGGACPSAVFRDGCRPPHVLSPGLRRGGKRVCVMLGAREHGVSGRPGPRPRPPGGAQRGRPGQACNSHVCSTATASSCSDLAPVPQRSTGSHHLSLCHQP